MLYVYLGAQINVLQNAISGFFFAIAAWKTGKGGGWEHCGGHAHKGGFMEGRDRNQTTNKQKHDAVR